MSLIKKYDGTTFNNVYAVNHYDGTKQFNDNIKPSSFDAVYFDGTGDYLTTPDNADFSFGSGSFTIEFQCNQLSSLSVGRTIFFHGTQSNNNNLNSIELMTNNAIRWLIRNSSTDVIDITSSSLSTNEKYKHIACVRNGNTFTIYLDGTSIGSATNSATLNDISDTVKIGYRLTMGGASMYFYGYLANFRISKGIARYTSNFTPSKEIPSVDSYTKLLITGESPLSDKCGKSITVNGNTSVMRSFTRVYSDSNNAIKIEGTGSYINVPNSSDFNLGSSNQTIDFWINQLGNADSTWGGGNLLCKRSGNSNSVRWISLQLMDTGNFRLYITSDTTSQNIASTQIIGNISKNTQYHVALIRNSNNFKSYINGIQAWNFDSSGSIYSDTSYMTIGGETSGNYISALKVMISDFRISSGIVRYTSNFNAYRTRLSVDSYTKLLITGESITVDKTGKSITAYGSTVSTKSQI